MKNFALLALALILFSVASVTESRGQVLTEQSITQAQWNVLDDSTASPQNLAGFTARINAGSPDPTVPELQISQPFTGGNPADVTGGWNFGTQYQFSLTNDLGGGYQLTLTQGSNTYQTGIFRPTAPYTDLVFVTQAASFPPDAGIEVTNLTLTLAGTPHSLGSLSAGSIEPQLFQGFVLDGASDLWSSITGKVTPFGNEAFIPNGGDFQFIIAGTSFQEAKTVPEPPTGILLLVSMSILLCYLRIRSSKSF